MTETTKTYEIPVESFKSFSKKIDTLRARAMKLSGSCDISIEVLPGLVDKSFLDPKSGRTHIVPCRSVVVNGSAPKVTSEWELVGVVDRKTIEGDVMFKMVPGQVRSQHALVVGTTGVCEHCGYARNRAATFILRNVETGEEKLVGRQCIKDFLGHVSPADVALMHTLMHNLFNQEVPGPRYTRERQAIEIIWYLTQVIYDISVRGFYDKFHTVAFASNVIDFASNGRLPTLVDDDVVKEIKARARITEETHPDLWVKAKSIVEWAKGQVDTNGGTYWENVNKVLKNEDGVMPVATERLIASIVVSYDRAMGNIKAKEFKKPSEYIGVVGSKVDLVLTLNRVHRYEFNVTPWQVSTVSICSFSDNNGNNIVWKASKFVDDAAVGKEYRVVGTVKAHEEYKGNKQTVLTRCKMDAQAA